MTTVSYALGRPRSALSRGGDCRAYDVTQARNVHGSHRFAATTDCRISNGMLRLTLGASGAAPALTVEAWRGALSIGGTYTDTYTDTYAGSTSAAAWVAMGTLTIDSPSVSALLTGVRIVHINAEAITIRLVSPLVADAYVTLRRGERMCRIHHGRTRPPFVDLDRRIRWTASPLPVGTAADGRVQEATPTIDGFPRFVAALDAVTTNAGAFSLTASSVVSARFGAGVGTWALRDQPADLHSQLGDASRPLLVVA